jgi:hypothetical protein
MDIMVAFSTVIALVILAIAAIVVALAIWIAMGNGYAIMHIAKFSAPSLTANAPNYFPSQVTVAGTVHTVGKGINATYIVFYETGPGANATYTGEIKDGTYSVSVQNVETYHVVVFWSGPYPWQAGSTQAFFGPTRYLLPIGANTTLLTKNINITTVNSTVKVKGEVRMLVPNVTPDGAPLRTPVKVVFGSTEYNRTFIANLTPVGKGNYSNYSTTLPNLMSYSVTVLWNGMFGTHGSCNAGTIYVYENDQGTSLNNEDYQC